MTLKEGVKYEQVEPIIDAFGSSVIGEYPGLHGATWAPNSSNDREVYVFPGWDSIEVYNFSLVSIARTVLIEILWVVCSPEIGLVSRPHF
jgi:hypothetical protein